MAHGAINANAKAKVLLLCLLLCRQKGKATNRKRAYSAYARRAMEIGEHAMHAFRLMKIPKITVKIRYRRPSSKRRNNFPHWIHRWCECECICDGACIIHILLSYMRTVKHCQWSRPFSARFVSLVSTKQWPVFRTNNFFFLQLFFHINHEEHQPENSFHEKV